VPKEWAELGGVRNADAGRPGNEPAEVRRIAFRIKAVGMAFRPDSG
jgi:hypothetical protein